MVVINTYIVFQQLHVCKHYCPVTPVIMFYFLANVFYLFIVFNEVIISMNVLHFQMLQSTCKQILKVVGKNQNSA